jgi:hypothetical protein
MSPSLSVVADNDLKSSPKSETVAERVRRLQTEAKHLAKDHVRSLSAQMVAIEQMAAEIAEGGEAYPPGIRELASRLVEDLESRVQTLEAIVSRTL